MTSCAIVTVNYTFSWATYELRLMVQHGFRMETIFEILSGKLLQLMSFLEIDFALKKIIIILVLPKLSSYAYVQ